MYEHDEHKNEYNQRKYDTTTNKPSSKLVIKRICFACLVIACDSKSFSRHVIQLWIGETLVLTVKS
jgi:hypothetical protein